VPDLRGEGDPGGDGVIATWRIVGMPAPKGSVRPMVTKTGIPVLAPGGSPANKEKIATWHAAVVQEMQPREGEPLLLLPEGPIAIAVIYRFPMRGGDLNSKKTGPKPSAPLYLAGKPDSDKLQRATFDAITQGGGVWRDDGQVALELSARVYVPPGHWTGAAIAIGPAAEMREVVSLYLDELERAAVALEQAKQQARTARAA
jgi:Holliday junction resolvase RusA-like endonuclease